MDIPVRIICIFGLVCLTACSTLAPKALSPLAACQRTMTNLDELVERYGSRDAQYTRVAGFPSYRTNRFWSSYRDRSPTDPQSDYLRQQLHALGMESLRIEWQNLPRAAQRQLLSDDSWPTFDEFERDCGDLLWQESLSRQLPQQALIVPASYSTASRVLGAYTLTKWLALVFIHNYQEEMTHLIDRQPNLSGSEWLHYRPPAAAPAIEAKSWLREARQPNPLNIPELPQAALGDLALYHAPRLQIAVELPADKIGMAEWRDGERQINHDKPAVYFRNSYIHYRDEVLLQLNYTLWFPERPKTSWLDWYAGKLDGLVWRVTLDNDGEVLFYDSIHPCGCYHTVHIPVNSELSSLAERPPDFDGKEPVLFFDATVGSREPQPLLSVQNSTHFLTEVGAGADTSGRSYAILPYSDLRSLPTAEGYKSWFDADGLIGSSARPERWFMWPLGVPRAGAMRQVGHHAIAFVGRRHFDEPSVAALFGLGGE